MHTVACYLLRNN